MKEKNITLSIRRISSLSAKKEKVHQLWTVVHPEKGMLVVCPECKVVPQMYQQKHCSNCGVHLGWDNIYIIDVKKEAANENPEHQANPENISEN
jgi:hypothetical protein